MIVTEVQAVKHGRKQKMKKTYSVKEKEKIIIQIKEITQEFIEEEKKNAGGV